MEIRHRDWDEAYKKIGGCPPKSDLWLDRHSRILEESGDIPMVDLGCGAGGDSMYLARQGYRVIACDLSQQAVRLTCGLHPEITGMSFDMLEGLPFHDSSKKIIISDLSLHYFRWEETRGIVREIKRVLTPGGYLLCRLNSTKDVNHGAGQGDVIEKHYYAVCGDAKRFFDREEVEALFNGWEMLDLNEYETQRYELPKVVWEAVLRNRIG